MDRTRINEARIGRYGCKLLAHMKEYSQDLYTELLFTGGLEDWLVEQNEICKERIWEYTEQIAKAQGMNLKEGATTADRNEQIGEHKA